MTYNAITLDVYMIRPKNADKCRKNGITLIESQNIMFYENIILLQNTIYTHSSSCKFNF